MALKHFYHPKPNVTKEEAKTWNVLRRDKSQVTHTADKRVGMVVLEKQDYINKAEDLLGQNDSYRTLAADPTKKQMNKVNNILRSIKVKGDLGHNT